MDYRSAATPWARVFKEERDQDCLAALVASWGFRRAGRRARRHRHPAVAYTAFWVDAR